jgi:hypothetical protein
MDEKRPVAEVDNRTSRRRTQPSVEHAIEIPGNRLWWDGHAARASVSIRLLNMRPGKTKASNLTGAALKPARTG